MKIIKSIIIICVSICFLSSCQNKKKVTEQVSNDADVRLVTNKIDYELFDDEGIVVEKFDSSVKDENRYNKNNKIYIPKTKIRYSCKYIDSKGKELFFRDSDKDNNGLWDLDVFDKTDKSSITSVLITVLPGTIFKYVPNYSQTGIQYEFIRNDGKIAFKKSRTGVVENEANIWMHPPRTKNFKVLELNPFPFIKRPYTIGNKWTWKLGIGDHWGHKDWKEWKGSIENNYKYEIIAKENLELKSGVVECYKIKSTATSRIGKTSLIAYFSEKYGFVKLDYTNINKTKIILEMTEYIKYDSRLDSSRY